MTYMTDPVSMAIYYAAIEYQIKTESGESHFLKHCMQADLDVKSMDLQ